MKARAQPVRRGVMAGFAVLGVAAAGWALMPHAARQSTVQWLDDICSTASGPMFSSAPASATSATGSDARPATRVTPLSCEPLPNVPGKSISTLMVEFPPRAFSPAHRHPGSVSAVVVEGTIRSQLGGGPVVAYATGQTWFEPPGTLHVLTENADPAHSAKLIATFVTDENCGPLVLPP